MLLCMYVVSVLKATQLIKTSEHEVLFSFETAAISCLIISSFKHPTAQLQKLETLIEVEKHFFMILMSKQIPSF